MVDFLHLVKLNQDAVEKLKNKEPMSFNDWCSYHRFSFKLKEEHFTIIKLIGILDKEQVYNFLANKPCPHQLVKLMWDEYWAFKDFI